MENKKSKLIILLAFIFVCIFFFRIPENGLIWTVISCGLLLPLVITIKSLKRKDAFLSVDFWFFGSMFLWSSMFPMDYLLGLEKQNPMITQTATLYAVANVICTLSFLFGKKIIFRYQRDENKPILNLGYNFRIETGGILVALGILLLLYHIQNLGGISSLGIQNRISNFQKDNSGLSFPWQTILSVGLLIMANATQKLKSFVVFIGILSLFLIFGFGARGDVLFVCLPALLLIFSRMGIVTSTFKKGLILFFILLIMSPLFTNLRGSILFQQPLSSYEKWEWAYNRGETGGAFRVTMDVVNRNRSTPWPADTYLLEAFSFLPSSIYEFIFKDKKFSSDKFFVENYYPWQAKNGMSFGFSPVAEAWQLGGIPLLAFIFSGIGFIVSYLNKFKQMIIILPSLMWFQRVSFDAFSSTLFFVIFFFFLAFIVNELLSRSKTRNISLNVGIERS